MKRSADCLDDDAALLVTRRSILRSLQSNNYEGRKTRWETLSHLWKNDPDVVFAALEKKIATIHGIPEHFYANRSFMLKVITQLKDRETWEILDDSFKTERSFVFAYVEHMWVADFEYVCALDAKYRGDCELWIKLAANTNLQRYDGPSMVTNLWNSSADPSLGKDCSVAHAWVTTHTSVIPFIGKKLFSSSKFLNRVLHVVTYGAAQRSCRYDVAVLVKAIPKFHQARVAEALLTLLEKHFRGRSSATHSRNARNDFYDTLHQKVGTHDRFKVAWFGTGGSFLSRFPKRWLSDEQVFLLLSKDVLLANRVLVDNYTQNGFLGRRDLMLKVVKASGPRLLSKSPKAIKVDTGILLEAMGSPATGSLDIRASSLFNSPLLTSQNLRYQKETKVSFDSLVLPAIWVVHGNGSSLSALSRAGNGVVKMLAEYLGYPFGHSVATLQRAFDQRASLCYEDEEEEDYDY